MKQGIRKLRMSAFVVMIFLILSLMFATTNVVSANKGRTWCVDFGIENAKVDNGQITYTVKILDEEKKETKEFPVRIKNIRRGWTPVKKAEEHEKKMKRYVDMFKIEVWRENQVVCFQFKDDAKYDDIIGGKIKEVKTGEKGVKIYDDPSTYLETVTFDIEGAPIDPAGEAILQIGSTYPIVSVATYSKPSNEIKYELVSSFNENYTGTGFVARINCVGEVEIPNVPCQEGVTGGADDSELTWTLSMEDPPIPEVPALTPPLFILALLSLFGLAAIAMRKMKR